jgi:glycosyltransferase involved in cell wall biosynthesis
VDRRRLVALPTRAIPRKNVAGALALCRSLDATLWILGPAEDGYGDELEALLDASDVEVRRFLPRGVTMADAYAACDLVVMPSTWEGFGNPVLESVTHRRPLALNPYPVAQEFSAVGLRFFHLDDVEDIERFLEQPDDALFDENLALARRHFNLADLPERLRRVTTGVLDDLDD